MGIGELPDAADYGDAGSFTLGHVADANGGLHLPNLQRFGIGNIAPIKGVEPCQSPVASFGKLQEASKGKDSTTGHWELGGLQVSYDFSYFYDGFPEAMMQRFMELTGVHGYLGNKAASGTEIIKELGEEHVKTGFPIVYTSADSVFQIAAHEEVIPLTRLYEICRITREELLVSPLMVGRVIARPFVGEPGNFTRTVNRKDYSLDPHDKTILDLCYDAGIPTVAIGKINDLFNHRGIRIKSNTKSNSAGCDALAEHLGRQRDSLIFVNLVDFDVYFGHRNDPTGFAKALEYFDQRLADITGAMDSTDHLVITADHGNDPTTPGTDHTREYVPLLYYTPGKTGEPLGIRSTFADVGKTAADFFGLQNRLFGKSFLKV